MGKPRRLSLAERDYLEQALTNGYSYSEMASRICVCTDTLKRILQREGLAQFDGAKYAISPSHSDVVEMWSRPCMKCGDKEPRRKWQYICCRCHELQETDCGGLEEYTIWDD
jgi:IS30 family transposase